MTAPRSRKETKLYNQHQKIRRDKGEADVCDFCLIGPDSDHDQFIKETKYFKLIRNIFPYSLWDAQPIQDHLMVVPKQHTESLSKLPQPAGIEFMRLIGEYEDQGYNLYARAPSSTIKTVPHQHTHLIKPFNRRIKFVFFLKRPYLRIKL